MDKKNEFFARDCMMAVRHVVPFIIFFEAALILAQWAKLSAAYTAGTDGRWYFFGYLFLLLSSTILLLLHKIISKNVAYVNRATTVYCIILIFCSLLFTWLDAQKETESVLIYAAIIILFPMLCLLEYKYIFVIEVITDLIMFGIGIQYYENVSAFSVNFLVFCIIALVVAFSYRKIRMKSYERQMELEELSDLRFKYAYMDEPTGLQNRRAFSEKLREMDAHSGDRQFTIWILDLNGLKQVNDRYGHAAGDEMIRGAGECIVRGVGKREKVYRIGGDEFAVIDTEGLSGDAVYTAIKKECGAWRGNAGEELFVSIGYASGLEDATLSASEIEREADHRMYAEKNAFYRK